MVACSVNSFFALALSYAPAALHVHILVLVHVYGLITRNSMLLLVYHCNYLGLIDVIVPVL